ncbi:MAG TPA: hypothetical protein VM425_02150 [Myxococcota bacterium]|nr:hypothetical protein [Myxococcota bacterium]
MKRWIVLSLGVAGVVWLAGCGGGDGSGFCAKFPADPLCHDSSVKISGSVCDQALQVIYSGIDAGCAGLPGCCFCQCWNSGRQVPAQTDQCSCEPLPQDSEPCEGEKLDQANQCLAARDSCRQEAMNMVAQYLCAQ